MFFLEDSLNVTLIGDWNKLYIEPEWMAEHVYETNEIELGINGKISEFSITYRSNGVKIFPSQTQLSFTAANTTNQTLEYFAKCINNFLDKAYTTELHAYGINIDFVEEDTRLFSDVLDNMSDSNLIINSGYQIAATSINRRLEKDGKIINMESSMGDSKLKVHFNEHHQLPSKKPIFTSQIFNNFIGECVEIVKGLDYEMEGEE